MPADGISHTRHGSVAVSRRCSIEQCELVGARQLLNIADADARPRSLVVAIDSQPALDWIACKNGRMDNHTYLKVTQVMQRLQSLSSLSVFVHLIWIKAHIGHVLN